MVRNQRIGWLRTIYVTASIVVTTADVLLLLFKVHIELKDGW